MQESHSSKCPDKWVRFYDQSYDDCIVGNRAGIEELSRLITELLNIKSEDPPSISLRDRIDIDTQAIVIDDTHNPCAQPIREGIIKRLIGCLIAILAITWIIILPVLGISAVIDYVRDLL